MCELYPRSPDGLMENGCENGQVFNDITQTMVMKTAPVLSRLIQVSFLSASVSA